MTIELRIHQTQQMTNNETNFLVERFYNILQAEKNGKKRTGIQKPIIVPKNRKVYITNFGEVCESLNRVMQDVSTYIKDELKIQTSITEKDELLIHGTCIAGLITEKINNYAKKYVQCPTCKSCDTSSLKENRIHYKKCNTCKSLSAIKE
jgi:translation initiation factor 2 subunit 2